MSTVHPMQARLSTRGFAIRDQSTHPSLKVDPIALKFSNLLSRDLVSHLTPCGPFLALGAARFGRGDPWWGWRGTTQSTFRLKVSWLLVTSGSNSGIMLMLFFINGLMANAADRESVIRTPTGVGGFFRAGEASVPAERRKIARLPLFL